LKRFFHFPPHEPNGNPKARQFRAKPLYQRRQSGQIVVEYVLLLSIAVTIAIMVTRRLVGREEGSEGMVIKAWQTLITQIGADHADAPDSKK
jgi:hypothetical protein